MNVPEILSVVFAATTGIAIARALRYRAKYRESKSILPAGTPFPSIPPDQFDPVFAQNELGAGLAAEVVLIGAGHGPLASTSDTEAWILGVFAKGAREIFEFGTATGRTTYLLARNAPADARVTTLTLPRSGHADYSAQAGDSAVARSTALEESVYEKFLYSGTAVEAKVTQLFGDSKLFDERPHEGRYDLIFIDGSHAYSYVKSDSEKAFRMLKPGGTIAWHDCRGKHPITGDVFRYLCELSRTKRLYKLNDTSLAVYRGDK